jgi:hypothetical protein
MNTLEILSGEHILLARPETREEGEELLQVRLPPLCLALLSIMLDN